ncbi:hypothetical protein V6119_24790, partial [Klebsiella pneumoniae]
ASTIFGVHYPLRNIRICQTVLRRRLRFIEVWVDGSFTTEKPEPDDIDILLVIDSNRLNLVPVMFQPQIEKFLNRQYIKHNYKIDLLLLEHGKDEDRMHWRGVFGHDREDTPKGIVRISL